MTADELAKKLGCSRATIFNLKKAYPTAAPKSFGNLLPEQCRHGASGAGQDHHRRRPGPALDLFHDLQAWKAFVLAHAIDPDLLYRLSR